MFACLAIFTAGPISCLPENWQRKMIFFGTLDAEQGKRLPVLRLEGMKHTSCMHPSVGNRIIKLFFDGEEELLPRQGGAEKPRQQLYDWAFRECDERFLTRIM